MKRPSKNKKIRDVVLILTNGRQTEKNYFDNLKNSFDSMFTIKTEFKNCECDRLVEYAISLDSANYNQIWCVFDIDNSYEEKHLCTALEQARQNNINIAYSHEAFEVWLLYHLTDTVKESLTARTYKRELDVLLSKDGSVCQYQKNDAALLKNKFIPLSLIATENAKKKYQQKEAEHKKMYYGNTNYRIWEWRSTTTVFKLIDELQLTTKNIEN